MAWHPWHGMARHWDGVMYVHTPGQVGVRGVLTSAGFWGWLLRAVMVEGLPTVGGCWRLSNTDIVEVASPRRRGGCDWNFLEVGWNVGFGVSERVFCDSALDVQMLLSLGPGMMLPLQGPGEGGDLGDHPWGPSRRAIHVHRR